MCNSTVIYAHFNKFLFQHKLCKFVISEYILLKITEIDNLYSKIVLGGAAWIWGPTGKLFLARGKKNFDHLANDNDNSFL
jgi:hypothetical protein